MSSNKSSTFSMRMTPQKKQEMEEFFEDLGLTIATAVNIFFENSLLVGGLPFEVRLPRYNAETEAAIQEARDIMSGRIQSKSYSSAGELFKELDEEC